MNNKLTYVGLLISILLGACGPGAKAPKEVEGWAPIYQSDTRIQEIRSAPPQPIQEGGKIYVKGKIMYQIEKGLGIHVMNIDQPENPQKVAFLEIPGAQEISIKEEFLYSNNFNDLVIIDISDHENIQLLNRIGNAFRLQGMDVPPQPGYYECISPSKGSVVGWERKLLHSPKCKY